MSRLFFLFAFLLTTASPVFGKQASGYYITLKGDTVEVQFSITHLGKRFKPSIDLSNNGRALYFDEENRLQYLSPADVLEIGATYKGHSIRKLSRQHPNISIFNSMTQYNHGYIFFDVHVDGLVKLISYIEHHPGGSHRQVMLQYDDHLLTQIEWNLFKDQMVILFQDNATLVEKIQQGVYMKDDLAQIVQEYNNYHTPQQRLRLQEAPANGF